MDSYLRMRLNLKLMLGKSVLVHVSMFLFKLLLCFKTNRNIHRMIQIVRIASETTKYLLLPEKLYYKNETKQ